MSNINGKSDHRIPPPKLSGIALKLLGAYKNWHEITRHIPKMRRYSLGVKIDQLFTDVIELISTAQFSPNDRRPPIISQAITRNDVLKFMLYVLLGLQGIEEKHFVLIAPQLEEIGRMLYGWQQRIEKENHSDVLQSGKQEKVTTRTTR